MVMRALCTFSCDSTVTKSARILQGCLDTHADAKWRYDASLYCVGACASDPGRARRWGWGSKAQRMERHGRTTVELIGHSDPKLAASLYAHLGVEALRDAVGLLAQ